MIYKKMHRVWGENREIMKTNWQGQGGNMKNHWKKDRYIKWVWEKRLYGKVPNETQINRSAESKREKYEDEESMRSEMVERMRREC